MKKYFLQLFRSLIKSPKLNPHPITPSKTEKFWRYNQSEIIEIFNNCKTAVELLEAREILESTGHFFSSETMIIYDINMLWHYEQNTIA
jgi:hypothetical protein